MFIDMYLVHKSHKSALPYSMYTVPIIRNLSFATPLYEKLTFTIYILNAIYLFTMITRIRGRHEKKECSERGDESFGTVSE